MSVIKFDRWENTSGVKYGNIGAVYSRTSSMPMFINASANTFYTMSGNELVLEIQPKSRSSEFLLMASILLGNNTNNAGFRFTRNGEPVGVGGGVNLRPRMSAITGWLQTGGDHSSIPVTQQFLDVPLSIDRLVYNIEVMGEGGVIHINRTPGWVTEGTNAAKATCASTFTIFEFI